MWETLDVTLAAHPSVRLVCIDPVSAFFPDRRDPPRGSSTRRTQMVSAGPRVTQF